MSTASISMKAAINGAAPDLPVRAGRDSGPRSAQGLRAQRGPARRHVRRAARGDLRAAGPQRGRQDHGHRDPRGLPQAHSGDARVLGADPVGRHGAGGSESGSSFRSASSIPTSPCARPCGCSRASIRLLAPWRTPSSSPGSGVGDMRVGRLSGGQRRRVDVAVGIAGNPELIFLDEPTTGFDPTARRRAPGA